MKSKIFFCCGLIVSMLVLSGCGGAGEGSSGSNAASGGSRSQWDLRKELMEAQEQLNQFAREHDLSEQDAVVQAEEAFMQAVQAFNTARREHPELAPLYEESDALQSESIQKRIAGDQEGFDQLMSQYRDVRAKLESKAKELPELQEIGEELKAAEKAASEALADAAAAVNGEGEKLAERVKELLAELD